MESSIFDRDNITASRTKEFSRAATGFSEVAIAPGEGPVDRVCQEDEVQSEKQVCDELPSKNAEQLTSVNIDGMRSESQELTSFAKLLARVPMGVNTHT